MAVDFVGGGKCVRGRFGFLHAEVPRGAEGWPQETARHGRGRDNAEVDRQTRMDRPGQRPQAQVDGRDGLDVAGDARLEWTADRIADVPAAERPTWVVGG